MSNKSFYYLMGGACLCPDGYTETSEGVCVGTDTVSPVVTHSDFCLAPSKRAEYSSVKTRIYNPGFSSSSIALSNAPTDTYAEMTNAGQWRATSSTNGPMNRCGVWVDSDCDGDKDSLVVNQEFTVAFSYNNTGPQRMVYVGIGADNQFQLKVNGNDICSTTDSVNVNNFAIWHIFPVTLIHGWNYFNAIATGDGSVNDSIGMTVYDNSPSQLIASNSDNNVGLSILFSSETLIGNHIDVATCPTGYNLQTANGQGDYQCIRTVTAFCG